MVVVCIYLMCLIIRIPAQGMNDTITAFLQERTIDSFWVSIDSLQNKGLTQTALTQLSAMLSRMHMKKNNAEMYKIILHELKFLSLKEENSTAASINVIAKYITTAPFPLNALLHSVQASLYWNYFQDNKWNIIQRSTTTE